MSTTTGEPQRGDQDRTRYACCINTLYEGAVGDYCTHLEQAHHCPPDLLDGLRHGTSQAHWRSVDDLHRLYLTTA